MVTLNFASSQQNIFQNAKNLVSNTVNQFIVRPLGSPNLDGVSGFLFDILEDEEVVLESIITDNYVEKNISIQDHIALRPLRFTLKGFVAELVNSIPENLAEIFIATQALPTLGGLTPQFAPQDQQFYAKVNNLSQSFQNVVNQTKNLYALFTGASTNVGKQQQGFQFFYQMWQTKQLCSVETPFGKFDNMAIESVRAIQSGATRDISDFTVSFKIIRIASAVSFNTNAPSLSYQQAFGSSDTSPMFTSGRLQELTAPLTNLGTDPGTAINTTQANSVFVNQAINQ